ncbi:MAG: hypothetical protein R6V39_08515, partial [Desulfovibrionales bacterium]
MNRTFQQNVRIDDGIEASEIFPVKQSNHLTEGTGVLYYGVYPPWLWVFIVFWAKQHYPRGGFFSDPFIAGPYSLNGNYKISFLNKLLKNIDFLILKTHDAVEK